jgi:hypothetical protein
MQAGSDINPRAGAAVLTVALGALAVALLSACRAPVTERATVSATPAHPGAVEYRLDPDATQIWLYLRADGPLAHLGHSHVISARALRGSIWLAPPAERSGCAFELAVADLVVDDPRERAQAGGEFSAPLDEPSRAGTRAHMLGASQLDAAQSPVLRMSCRALRLDAADGMLDLTVTLRGHDAQLAVPVHWQRSADSLQARGEFDFRQTSLGLEPYSVGLGALRVADQIHARYRMVARRP